MNYKNLTYIILMLVFFILIGYNVKEKFGEHKFINTFNQGCSRGFYCPKDTDYARKCNKGYYCPDGKDQKPCKQGSFCPGNPAGLYNELTPSRSYIEQMCPRGYYCPSRGLLEGSVAIPCEGGNICCYRGESDSELLFGDCKTPDEVRSAVHREITKPGSPGWRSRSFEKRCPGGFYCPVDLNGNSDGRIIKCSKGDYCPEGSTSPKDCPSGFYCPPVYGLNNIKIYGTKKIKCLVKQFNKSKNPNKCRVENDGMAYCAPYCPKRSFELSICKRGHKCPVKERNNKKIYGTKQIKCGNEVVDGLPSWKAKTILSKVGDKIVKNHIRGGKYQKYGGSTECDECPLGIDSNNNRTSCRGCPAGHYCNDIENDPIECKPGTYVHKTYPCTDKLCKGGSKKQIESGDAQYPNKCFICPPGQYQDKKGSFQCKPCEKGTYQDLSGQSQCKNCKGGFYQDLEGGIECKPCESGHYCSNCEAQKDRYGCELQDCLWNENTQSCKKKPIQIIENNEVDSDEWDKLGLTNKNVSKETAVKLINKNRTISKAKRKRAKITKGRKEISSDDFLELSKSFNMDI